MPFFGRVFTAFLLEKFLTWNLFKDVQGVLFGRRFNGSHHKLRTCDMVSGTPVVCKQRTQGSKETLPITPSEWSLDEDIATISPVEQQLWQLSRTLPLPTINQ